MKIAKKVLSVFLITTTLLSLSGCKNNEIDETVESAEPSSSVQPSPSPRTTHTPSQIEVSSSSDLFGQWEQFDSVFPGAHQVAIISEDIIEIYWINEEHNTRYLYWSGSFPESNSVELPYSWVSKNNVERAKTSPSSSWDETKIFTFEDGQIYYSTTSMGITATPHLEKKNWTTNLPEGELFENDIVPFSAAGIEFPVPDFFEKDAKQTTKGNTSFTMYHGRSAGCILNFLEYNLTKEEFSEKEDAIITGFIVEGAEDIETHTATIAGLDGKAFSYHIVNEKNIIIHVYGVLLCNLLEEKAVLFTLTLPRENDYQELFNRIAEGATRKSLVGDIKWDLAFEHGTKTSTEYYLIDFDSGIAIRYVRGRGKKVDGIYVGKASGSLDDVLDVAFETTDGGERHYYFTWRNPDDKGSSLITHLYENGGEDYFVYSETSVDSAVRDVKNYIITP